VAGKTGTAQKVVEGKKGYAKNKYVASFVGFAPSRNPRLVVLVAIDEPKGDYYGGLVSAPVFKNIMEQGLAYLKVPPEKEYLAKNATKKEEAKKKNNIKKIAKKQPTEEVTQAIAGPDLDIQEFKPSDNPESTIPNFTGLSVREALRKAQKENLRLKVLGSGICNQQEPQPGNQVADEELLVTLHCSPAI
jgi:cell division protein FtsI (penicillin-binding protein 3)